MEALEFSRGIAVCDPLGSPTMRGRGLPSYPSASAGVRGRGGVRGDGGGNAGGDAAGGAAASRAASQKGHVAIGVNANWLCCCLP